MLKFDLRRNPKVWMGILTVSIALNSAPASAGGFGDFLRRLFHPSMPETPQSSVPVEERSTFYVPPQPEKPEVVSQPEIQAAPAIPVTSDSSFQVPGTVPENARWLAVSAQKDGKEVLFANISATPGAPLPTVYLTDGPGIYSIVMYQSDGIRVTDKKITSFKVLQVKNEDTRDNQFLLPSLSVQSDAPEIVELAHQITQGLVTDREKAHAIFLWVATHISYDTEGVKDRSYTSRSLDALTVLQSRLTVCEGYSNLYAALLRAVGIRSKVIIGKAFGQGRPSDVSPEQVCQKDDPHWYGHGWNEVYVDNRWILVDTTFAAQYNTAPGLMNENFDRDEEGFSYAHQKCQDAGR